MKNCGIVELRDCEMGEMRPEKKPFKKIPTKYR